MTATFTLYRKDASDTSIEAAESINVTQMEGVVLFHIWQSGANGMTQDELIEALGSSYRYSTITARPAALKRKGLIIDSGKRRPGISGRSQMVLITPEHAE
jgi:hypothetical protein